jgi:integrase
MDKAFRRNANDCGMADVTPHTLRHSAATWQMQTGTDLWQAARFLGMTAEQLERTYGHHHPDHLMGAVEAYERLPRRRGERTGSATFSRPQQRNRT